MEGQRLVRPVLNGNIRELGSRLKVEIVNPAGKCLEVVGRLKIIHNRDPAVLSTDDQCMRENRGACPGRATSVSGGT